MVAKQFHRDEAVQLREVAALRLRANGMTLQQVAEAVGYANKSSAKRAVDRLLADVKFSAVDEYRQLQLAQLEAALAHVTTIMYADHVHVADGRVVRDKDTGHAILDRGPNLAAAREFRQLTERIARLLGLDAPTRRIVEIIGEDAVDAAIRQLEAEMEAKDAAALGSGDRSAAGEATPAP